MLVRDKVIIISGIGPGLGAKLAIEAATQGAAGIALCGRSPDKLQAVATRLAEVSSDVPVLQLITDIRERGSCEGAVDAVLNAFGRIDSLINNAYCHGNFEHMDTADVDGWSDVLATNLQGTLKMTQAVIPAMKTARSGSVVMINTQAVNKPVVLPMGTEAGYAASKAALANTAKYLALELGQFGIRVNTASMGWMWGEAVQGYVHYQSAKRQVDKQVIIDEICTNIPLKRIPTDDECAQAALFLISDFASGITGATLDVNGGEYMP